MFNNELARKALHVFIALMAAAVVFIAFAQLSIRWEQKQLGSRYIFILSDKTVYQGHFHMNWVGDFEVRDSQGVLLQSFSADYLNSMVRVGKPAPISDPWRGMLGLALSLFAAVLTYLSVSYLVKRADL